MDRTEADINRNDLEALRALQADAQELERIQDLLDRFNVFEAIGFVDQEVMHSRFLAFLLDPEQNHNLGDGFLRKMLEKASASSKSNSLPEAFEDISGRNTEQTAVQTEVRTDDGRIDILLLNEVGGWATIIENKVWSTEHSDQLDRYYRFVKKDHPNWRLLGIYLTPYGDASSHEAYLPLSYGTVCEAIDEIMEDRGPTLTPDVRMAMEHYTAMLRRNILGDPEVSRLCREIHRKHHRALHAISNNLSASQQELHKLLKNLVKETPNLAYGYREPAGLFKDWDVFDHREWDVPALRVGDRYQNSNRLLYFVFYSDLTETLEIWLELGPGDADARSKLLAMAHKNPTVFNEVPDALSECARLLTYRLLTPEQFKDLSDGERKKEIRRRWAEFLNKVLPRVEDALKEEAWIWESDGIQEGR